MRSPLHAAAQRGPASLLKLLLEHRPDVNVRRLGSGLIGLRESQTPTFDLDVALRDPQDLPTL
jgi:hypothetical protein